MLATPSSHRLRFGRHLELALHDSGSLHVVRGEGRGMQLQVPAGWTSVWLPLSGALQMTAHLCSWRVEVGESLFWTDGALCASSPEPAWWIALAMPTQLWGKPSLGHAQGARAELVPWQATCSRELRRAIVRLARRSWESTTRDHLGLQVVESLLHEQQDAHVTEWLSRCSGRTQARRHQSLLRLMRVQRTVRDGAEGRLELSDLARCANYSPHHLIRVYRKVFGETPAEHASRVRTRRAWQLVRTTSLPICEITEMLGFESQSAFCRAFKNAYGMTTSEARRHAPQAPRARNADSMVFPTHGLEAA